MDRKKELQNTFIEEYRSAKLLYSKNMIKSAVILLSKAIFALSDHIILNKHNKLVRNHTERFRFLREKEPRVYELVDSVWEKYTDSYNKPSSEEAYMLLIKAIDEILENETSCQEIKKSIE